MLRSIILGMATGYAATAVMSAAQTTLIPTVASRLQVLFGEQKPEEPSGGGQEGEAAESSPVKVARRAAKVLGVDLSHKEAMAWGNRVHWLYGTQWGVVYLLLFPKAGLGSGLLFGTALWAASDELMLWALGIAKAPTAYHLPVHLKALAAHLVYGGTAGAFGRGLRC